ncbi:hypothetical protein EMQ25_12305 [Arsenicitalea aurantiaca]|uniref:Transglutaminase domain-containing protein n=1 Tax=Arsenicitalea aurantiaca TaxID=1783274 RepID=A0A433X7S5_9HYPH|nr:hypothetical protein [Arsenicitalea aurantiaca]RUT30103.1 hypothetical protein EMQ25_12305 [Arsenicitalea aurantiaca]
MGHATRSGLLALGLLALTLPVFAGEPYEPVPLAPAETVTPPEALIAAATALFRAAEAGDGDALAGLIAEAPLLIDGALELAIPRRAERIGPFDGIDARLAALADNIGGSYERPFDGSDTTPYAVRAELEFIMGALSDDNDWGRDPLLAGAICSYGYRTFPVAAVAALAGRLGIQSSGFFFVSAPADLRAAPAADREVIGALLPDRLYALNYDAPARSPWIGVHLPGGGTGFISFDETPLEKPYASGICFEEGPEGQWRMTAQTATNL